MKLLAAVLVSLFSLTLSGAASGQDYPTPTAEAETLAPLSAVEVVRVAAPDLSTVTTQDLLRELDGEPPRFAVPNTVSLTPMVQGKWEDLGDGRLVWRLRIQAPRAVSVNLGFERYVMPKRGRLYVYSADGSKRIRPFTASDNKSHGELWTPPLESDDLVVEVTIDAEDQGRLELELSSIGYGYREFGSRGLEKSGSCNVDVVCPEGDGWREQIRSVAVYSLGGGTFCTGALVNNTSLDQTPYFLTAAHCGLNAGNAASLVTFWNFENSTCRPPGSPASGGPGDGTLDEFVTGATFRAGNTATDMTLLELDASPVPFGAFFAGWDRSSANASSATAIHHPNTDEKRISFENDATTTTSYSGSASPGNGTHVRVADWDVGTTEPGSSGSPLFDQNKRIVGQLHGGFAACGNDLADWYGRLSQSWTGGGSSSTRLSNWLDPTATGAAFIDGLDMSSNVPQDDFTERGTLSGNTGQSFAVNSGATGESGEPDHAGSSAPLASIWWEWTAPTTGDVTFDTFGSDFDTTLAVYTGTAVNALVEVASNDDAASGGLQSSVSFTATSGTSYKIAVDGFDTLVGNIVLGWNLVPDAACSIDVRLSYQSPTLKIGFEVETQEPTLWATWIAVGPFVVPLWTLPIPAPLPPTSFELPVPFPQNSAVSVLSLFLTLQSGQFCSDFESLSTGSPAAPLTREQLEKRVKLPTSDR